MSAITFEVNVSAKSDFNPKQHRPGMQTRSKTITRMQDKLGSIFTFAFMGKKGIIYGDYDREGSE